MSRGNLSEISGYRGYERHRKKMRLNLKKVNLRKITPGKSGRGELDGKNPYQEKLERQEGGAEREISKKNWRRRIIRGRRLRAMPDKLPFAGDYIRRSNDLNLFSQKGGTVDLASKLRQGELSLMGIKKKK